MSANDPDKLLREWLRATRRQQNIASYGLIVVLLLAAAILLVGAA